MNNGPGWIRIMKKTGVINVWHCPFKSRSHDKKLVNVHCNNSCRYVRNRKYGIFFQITRLCCLIFVCKFAADSLSLSMWQVVHENPQGSSSPRTLLVTMFSRSPCTAVRTRDPCHSLLLFIAVHCRCLLLIPLLCLPLSLSVIFVLYHNLVSLLLYLLSLSVIFVRYHYLLSLSVIIICYLCPLS